MTDKTQSEHNQSALAKNDRKSLRRNVETDWRAVIEVSTWSFDHALRAD